MRRSIELYRIGRLAIIMATYLGKQSHSLLAVIYNDNFAMVSRWVGRVSAYRVGWRVEQRNRLKGDRLEVPPC